MQNVDYPARAAREQEEVLQVVIQRAAAGKTLPGFSADKLIWGRSATELLADGWTTSDPADFSTFRPALRS